MNMKDLYNEVLHIPPVGHFGHQCSPHHPRKDPNIKPLSRKERLMKMSRLSSTKRNGYQFLMHKILTIKLTILLQLHEVQLLDETLPEIIIRAHNTDKPWAWMTSHTDKEIKARQRGFTSENVIKNKELCENVSVLMRKMNTIIPTKCYGDIIYSNWLVLKQIIIR